MKSERLRLAAVLADSATIGYIRTQYPWLAKELSVAAAQLEDDEAEIQRLLDYAEERYKDGRKAGSETTYTNYLKRVLGENANEWSGGSH